MMYIDNEVLEKMIMTIVEGFDRIEKKLDRMNRLKDCLDAGHGITASLYRAREAVCLICPIPELDSP